MADDPQPPAAQPELAATVSPRRPGRPPGIPPVPKPVDTRPLADRVNEAYENLRVGDGVIRSEMRRIENCERERRDTDNRIAIARAAIRAREKGLEKEAVRIIQKQTGIQTIPGFTHEAPKGLSAWLLAKKAAEAAAKAAAYESLKHTPTEPTP